MPNKRKPRQQLIVAVTHKDIAFGLPEHMCECPIALALKRRYDGADIEVDYESVRVGTRAPIPISAQMEHWMMKFDRGDAVKPTTFFLDAPA